MTEEAEKCAPQATIFTNENATIEATSVKKEEKIVDINSCPERGPDEEYSPRFVEFILNLNSQLSRNRKTQSRAF
jgi:hypothetical protein